MFTYSSSSDDIKPAQIHNPSHSLFPYVSQDYSIVKKVCSGSNSIIYEGFHRPTKLPVAIKQIPIEIENCSCFSMVNKQNITIFSSLDFPFICHFFEVIEGTDCIFVIMEYSSKGNLASLIHKYGRIPEDQAKLIFSEIVSAIIYLHEYRGLLHENLTPEHVLFDSFFHTRLIGFKHSKIPGETGKYKCPCINNFYSSPEALNSQNVDKKSDIWSLGVILYQMTTGILPFMDYEGLKSGIIELQYPSYFSSSLKDLIDSMLQFDQNSRIGINQVKSHNWLLSCPIPMFDSSYFISEKNNVIQKISSIAKITRKMKIELLPLSELPYLDALKSDELKSTPLSSSANSIQNKLKGLPGFQKLRVQKKNEVTEHPNALTPLALIYSSSRRKSKVYVPLLRK